MHAEWPDETELKWLIRAQLKQKAVTSVSAQRTPKPGYGPWRRKLTSIRKNQLCSLWQEILKLKLK